MRRLFISLLFVILTACSTTGLTPSLSADGQLSAAKAEYSAETAVNVADNAYLAAEAYLSPDMKARAKAYLGQAHDLLVAARSAQTLGDQAALTDKIAAIMTIKASVLSITDSVKKD